MDTEEARKQRDERLRTMAGSGDPKQIQAAYADACGILKAQDAESQDLLRMAADVAQQAAELREETATASRELTKLNKRIDALKRRLKRPAVKTLAISALTLLIVLAGCGGREVRRHKLGIFWETEITRATPAEIEENSPAQEKSSGA